MSEPISTVAMASALVSRELMELALSLPESERGWFFDPRNRDQWMDTFIARLQQRYQQPDRIASND